MSRICQSHSSSRLCGCPCSLLTMQTCHGATDDLISSARLPAQQKCGLCKLHCISPRILNPSVRISLALLRDYPGTQPTTGENRNHYPFDQTSLVVSLSNHAWFAGMIYFSNQGRFAERPTKFAGIIALFSFDRLSYGCPTPPCFSLSSKIWHHCMTSREWKSPREVS